MTRPRAASNTRRTRPRGDAGAASILLAAGVSVLLVTTGAVVAVSDLVATGQHAATAADLAALAAAHRMPYGSVQACDAAAAVAARNRARLQSCRAGIGTGFDVEVVTAVEVTGPLRAVAGWLGLSVPAVRSRAIAGPPPER